MLSDADRQTLFALIRDKSFRTGDFTLASGKKSNMYFNLKPTMMNATGSMLSARAFLSTMAQTGTKIVSGLEMGAVPIIGAMAAVSAIDGAPVATTFVRKSAKGHGTKAVIEGLSEEDIAGQSVLVIDDVSTTGGSTLKAIEAVRSIGGVVEHAACLLNRGQGGDELMADNGVTLHSVFTAGEFLAES